jgi:hypothetical protein
MEAGGHPRKGVGVWLIQVKVLHVQVTCIASFSDELKM